MAGTKPSLIDITLGNQSAFASGSSNFVFRNGLGPPPDPDPEFFYLDVDAKTGYSLDSNGDLCEFYLGEGVRFLLEDFSGRILLEDGSGTLRT